MPDLTPERPQGLGLTATTLGSVGMLLFFLPILGAPLSGIGFICGIVGVGAALAGNSTSLRWAAAGLCVSSVALAINVVLAYTPLFLVPNYPVRPAWQTAADRPYVPPPARPGQSFDVETALHQ